MGTGTEALNITWQEHPNVFSSAISKLRTKDTFTDVTLACEGSCYPANKFVLSTCSEYFQKIFEWTPCVNPVIIINNISPQILEAILDFMYKGEASIFEWQLQDLLKAGQYLFIKGLYLSNDGSVVDKNKDNSHTKEPQKKKIKTTVNSQQTDFSSARPEVESPFFHQPSPTQSSSSYSGRPTPTPPPNPSPLRTDTPPINSSPLVQSSAQKFGSISLHSKSTSHLLNVHNLPQNKMLPQLSEIPKVVNCVLPQIESPLQSNPLRSSYVTNIKNEDSNFILPSLHNSVLPEQISHVSMNASNLQIAQSVRDLGDTINLDKVSTKMLAMEEELKIDTDDGTTTIPKILDEFEPTVHHMYGNVDNRNNEPSQVTDTKIQSNLYDFMEDVPETSGISRIKNFAKKDNQRTYTTRKNNHETEYFDDYSLSDSDEYNSSEKYFVSTYSHSLAINPSAGLDEIKNDVVQPVKVKTMPTSGMAQFNPALSTTEFTPTPVITPTSVSNVVSNSIMTDVTAPMKYAPTTAMTNFRTSVDMTKFNPIPLMKECASTSIKAKFSSTSETLAMTEFTPAKVPSTSGKRKLTPKTFSNCISKSISAKSKFSCTLCLLNFMKQDTFNKHMRQHAQGPFVCKICSAKYESKESFNIHSKIHLTFKCDKCPFATTRDNLLTRHKEIHVNCFKCKHCSYTAVRSSTLTSHIRKKHQNEK